MDPIAIATLVTALGPVAVVLLKKLFRTGSIPQKEAQRTIHAALPLAVGLGVGILGCMAAPSCDPAAGCTWSGCVLAGLAGGAGASYVRDFDKNVLGIADAIAAIIAKRKGDLDVKED